MGKSTELGHTRRRRIGFDLDGVIFDTLPEYVKICNQLAGTEYTARDLRQYSFSDVSGWNQEIANAAYLAVAINQDYPLCNFTSWLFEQIRAREDMSPHLFFISSRISLLHRVTAEKLELCVEHPWSLHTGYHNNTKWAAVQGLNLDYFVEDSLGEARAIVDHSECLVFLIGMPYNQGASYPGIVRVSDLLEVGKCLWGKFGSRDAESENPKF